MIPSDTEMVNNGETKMHLTTENHVSALVVTWILIIPLLYFASQGLFWFQRGGQNNQLVGTYGAIATTSISGENIATSIGVFLLLFVLLVPLLFQIITSVHQDVLFGVLTLWAFISAAWSQVPLKSLEWSLCLAGNTLFSFYLHRRFSPGRLLQLFLTLGWISLVGSIAVALFFPQFGVSYLEGSWQGLYLHKNFCALTTVFFLPAAFYIPKLSLSSKLLNGIYFLLSIFLIIMTQSRTGWMTLGMLVLFFVLLNLVQRFSSASRLSILVVLAPVVGIIGLIAYSYSSTLLYLIGKDPTLTGRTDIWQAISEPIRQRPILGYGYMGFWRGFTGASSGPTAQLGWAITSAHNGFLEILLELGGVGLALLIFSFIRATRDILTCLTVLKSPYLYWCASIVFLTAITAIDEQQMMVPNNLMWMLYLLACIGLSGRASLIRAGSLDE